MEGEGAGSFEPENGTVLLQKVDGAYPESLPVSQGADGTYKLAGNYNYADFQIQSGQVSDQYGDCLLYTSIPAIATTPMTPPTIPTLPAPSPRLPSSPAPCTGSAY